MSQINTDIDEARCDMAAIFRWVVREGMHEGIANHFSCAVSDDGQTFLINPYGIHFSRLKASDLRFVHGWTRPPGQSMGPCIETTRRPAASCICIRITPPR
jgi:hypothetical protein